METVLQELIVSLREASEQIRHSADPSLEHILHPTNGLPQEKVSDLASEALDLLSNLRLMLEPRHLILADHFMGYMNTKALCTAVELGVTDHLLDGPKTVIDLAKDCGARPDRFRQIMRSLANNGIFNYSAEADSYFNNSTSLLLSKTHWTQWHNWVELYGNEFYDMARGIPASVREGAIRNPAQINFDTDDNMFKYFTEKGWMPKFFKTLSGGAIAQAPGILEDYPWHEVSHSTVLDVGGGSGGLIALLLRRYKHMKGGILDLPKSIELAKLNFHTPEGQYADVGAQVNSNHLLAGDFFKEVPRFEVYVMKWCLHDWSDEKALVILQNIRRAIKEGPNSRLVVLESVLADGHMGRMSRYGDLNMMVAVGGGERDEQQWRGLAKQSGWLVQSIRSLRNAWPSAIEFVPVKDSKTCNMDTSAER